MKKIFTITGSITFSAIGAFSEKFISELIESGIFISNMHNENNIIYSDARRIDYLKISKIAKKHKVKIRIVKRKGLYFKIRKARRHLGILTGISVAAFILLIMQNFIWKIEIYGNEKLSENLIIKTISESGIELGHLVSDMDTKGAEIKLKSILKDVAWVNIEIKGSRADVYIRETEALKKAEISPDSPCNIIAGRTGIIVETEVYSGTLMYPKGSAVSKGNVIVSGVVNDGADNLLLSHANAKIIAEFTETVELRQDYTTIEKERSGLVETEKELMLFGFVIPITERVLNTENKICNEEIQNCAVFGLNLPWKLKVNTYEAYDEISVTRTAQDALQLVEQKLEIYCNNFFSEYTIQDIRKSIKSDESCVTLIADIKMKGNIAVKQEILEKPIVS